MQLTPLTVPRSRLSAWALLAITAWALTGCNAHGIAYYLFKPLWTKSLPHDIELGISTPYIVLMEGDMSEWKYMNEVDERTMAQAFEQEFKAELAHERHAKPGNVDGAHSIVVEAIRLSETTRKEKCNGQSYTLHSMVVEIDCIYRAPGMHERRTIRLDEMEHLRKKEKEDEVVCKVKNIRASFENLVLRGADKAFAKYASVWHKHRKQAARKAKRAAKKAAKEAAKHAAGQAAGTTD